MRGVNGAFVLAFQPRSARLFQRVASVVLRMFRFCICCAVSTLMEAGVCSRGVSLKPPTLARLACGRAPLMTTSAIGWSAVSVAVLLSALAVAATGWLWLDAITAIGVGLAVMASALGLLREAIALNLDAAPRHINLAAVEAALLELPGVEAVEELHVWGLSTSRTALTTHLRLGGEAAGEAGSGDALLAAAQARLEALGIRKSTIQLERPQAPA